MTDQGIAERGSKQQGWPPGFVLVQVPNTPLIVALVAVVVAHLAGGRLADFADAVSRLALAVFAYLELTDGVNWFRRLLGAVVLAYVTLRLTAALH